VKTLLLTAESDHSADADPEVIVTATFSSFDIHGKQGAKAGSANSNTDCNLCHMPGHTDDRCPKFAFCVGCKKIHSRNYKCPSGGLPKLDGPPNKYSNGNDTSNKQGSSKQGQVPSKKRPLKRSQY
jgi:hypothetical protein